MLLKPVKQDYLLPQPPGDEPPPGIRQEPGGRSEKASLGKIGHHDWDAPPVCRQSISDSWLGNLRECLAHLV
jgi:hypothetical protein